MKKITFEVSDKDYEMLTHNPIFVQLGKMNPKEWKVYSRMQKSLRKELYALNRRRAAKIPEPPRVRRQMQLSNPNT